MNLNSYIKCRILFDFYPYDRRRAFYWKAVYHEILRVISQPVIISTTVICHDSFFLSSWGSKLLTEKNTVARTRKHSVYFDLSAVNKTCPLINKAETLHGNQAAVENHITIYEPWRCSYVTSLWTIPHFNSNSSTGYKSVVNWQSVSQSAAGTGSCTCWSHASTNQSLGLTASNASLHFTHTHTE
jgi:hypothetical protein